MEDILVSVVMPVHNSLDYLDASITSVLNQTLKNLQLIIVDDGSDDGSSEKIDYYASIDNRITAVHRSVGGVSVARNCGLSLAKGTWVAFVDSDDTVEPQTFETMVNSGTNYDMVICGAYRDDVIAKSSKILALENANVIGKEGCASYLLNVTQSSRDIFLNYLWNRIIRREVIDNSKIQFNEEIRLGEDFLFICESIKNCRSIAILDTPFYHYYYRGQASLISKFDSNEYSRRHLMYETMCSLYRYFGIYEESYDFIMQSEGRYCLSSIHKIKFKSCNLSFSEKIQYIRNFVKLESKKCILAYLRTQKGLSNSFKRIVYGIGNPYIIYFILML